MSKRCGIVFLSTRLIGTMLQRRMKAITLIYLKCSFATLRLTSGLTGFQIEEIFWIIFCFQLYSASPCGYFSCYSMHLALCFLLHCLEHKPFCLISDLKMDWTKNKKEKKKGFWVIPLYVLCLCANKPTSEMNGLRSTGAFCIYIYILYFVASVFWVVVHQEGMNVTILDA